MTAVVSMKPCALRCLINILVQTDERQADELHFVDRLRLKTL